MNNPMIFALVIGVIVFGAIVFWTEFQRRNHRYRELVRLNLWLGERHSKQREVADTLEQLEHAYRAVINTTT